MTRPPRAPALAALRTIFDGVCLIAGCFANRTGIYQANRETEKGSNWIQDFYCTKQGFSLKSVFSIKLNSSGPYVTLGENKRPLKDLCFVWKLLAIIRR